MEAQPSNLSEAPPIHELISKVVREKRKNDASLENPQTHLTMDLGGLMWHIHLNLLSVVVIVVFKRTGFSKDLLSHYGVGSDGSIESGNWRSQSKEGERKAELHLRVV